MPPSKGNPYLTLRDQLGMIFQDEDFAALFPACGRPSLPPWRPRGCEPGCLRIRRASYNRAALRAAQLLVPEDATLDTVELDGIPGFNQDEESHPPAKVVELKARVRAADAVLFVTPEYNYSIPGVLKNAIDWASRPYGDNAWNGKPVAVLGASVGMLGSARAQYHLRQVFVFLNMYPVNQPEVMIAHAAERFDATGHLIDAQAQDLIRQLLRNLVAWTRLLQQGQRGNA